MSGRAPSHEVRPALRARGRRRRPWWRWAITATLACAALGAVLYYLASTGTRIGSVALLPGMNLELPAAAVHRGGAGGRAVAPLDFADRRRLDEQRRIAAALARRHVGTVPRGSRDDLRILQRILDAGAVGPDRTYELQALGVVLGDLLARELGMHWVVYRDEHGRSRALQLGESDAFLFPVTMISKRLERGIGVDVLELYEQARQVIEQAGARRGWARTGS